MDNDTLYSELQKRLIESGEWSRLQQRLHQVLNEAGWIDDVKHDLIESGQEFDGTLQAMLDSINSPIPAKVQTDFKDILKEWIQTQLNK